jgi:hypothetical protein
MAEVYHQPGVYLPLLRPSRREILFVSIASATESFRSRCGSVRSRPECSKQRFPAGTPHVGQGTASNSLGVRPFNLTRAGCAKTRWKAIQFGMQCSEFVVEVIRESPTLRLQVFYRLLLGSSWQAIRYPKTCARGECHSHVRTEFYPVE